MMTEDADVVVQNANRVWPVRNGAVSFVKIRMSGAVSAGRDP